jgi:hypothetical protein
MRITQLLKVPGLLAMVVYAAVATPDHKVVRRSDRLPIPFAHICMPVHMHCIIIKEHRPV